jgi:hypothetical protein
MKTGIELIAEERNEQITKHYRSVEHDVAVNKDEQLIRAANQLLMDNEIFGTDEQRMKVLMSMVPVGWNPDIYKKMISKPFKERLVIVGALIAAEIDRIQAQ